nr:hypothetical protein [Tanacetum cinerariifolium]
GLPADGHTVECCAAQQDGIRTQRAGLQDVGAAPDAAVEENAELAFGDIRDGGQAIERGGDAIQLPTAVIGHHNPVQPQV